MIFIPIANFYIFSPGQKLINPLVESRLFLLIESGIGELRINTNKYTCEPGKLFLFPWNHEVIYTADEADPMSVATVHIIPECTEKQPVYRVSHRRESDLYHSPYRKDNPAMFGTDFWVGGTNHGISSLIHYIISVFDGPPPVMEKTNLLGHLLLEEFNHLKNKPKEVMKPYPEPLLHVTRFIDFSYFKSIKLETLTKIARVSSSTLIRLFKTHLGKTPIQYIIDIRLQHARLLLENTSLSIAEVGSKVGIEDQFYFSKIFKNKYKISAQNYRKTHMVL